MAGRTDCAAPRRPCHPAPIYPPTTTTPPRRTCPCAAACSWTSVNSAALGPRTPRSPAGVAPERKPATWPCRSAARSWGRRGRGGRVGAVAGCTWASGLCLRGGRPARLHASGSRFQAALRGAWGAAPGSPPHPPAPFPLAEVTPHWSPLLPMGCPPLLPPPTPAAACHSPLLRECPTLMLRSPVHAARCVLRSTNTCCSPSPGRRGPYLGAGGAGGWGQAGRGSATNTRPCSYRPRCACVRCAQLPLRLCRQAARTSAGVSPARRRPLSGARGRR